MTRVFLGEPFTVCRKQPWYGDHHDTYDPTKCQHTKLFKEIYDKQSLKYYQGGPPSSSASASADFPQKIWALTFRTYFLTIMFNIKSPTHQILVFAENS